MTGSVSKVLTALFVASCLSTAASAATIKIGLLSLDPGTPTGDSFSIVNLTGLNAFPPDFPIETQLAISVTGLTANTTGGPLTIGGGVFASDAAGNVSCTLAGDAATGGCNFAAYNISSAILTGTLSPVAGLVGLPAGFVGIQSGFTATITPGCGQFLIAGCDVADVEATLVPAVAPEPSSAMLFATGIGLLAAYARNRRSPRPRWLRAHRE
jgi:hypothetical protein